ncbi:hypothetical protein P872_07400 [Rhodonellum psychrophilum GCM71 = DSM 17998]|uniref:Uncharacterized protein n=1 Tax=Rhodonellum psychrophilum GCM71 = DSM 17998 TaxID=1123057 RepID=U5BNU9_9BACT|nr:hypothetical protein P872_07400 [Rhodonellum psychrophilum GCM71 = DSM 17998]
MGNIGLAKPSAFKKSLQQTQLDFQLLLFFTTKKQKEMKRN